MKRVMIRNDGPVTVSVPRAVQLEYERFIEVHVDELRARFAAHGVVLEHVQKPDLRMVLFEDGPEPTVSKEER